MTYARLQLPAATISLFVGLFALGAPDRATFEVANHESAVYYHHGVASAEKDSTLPATLPEGGKLANGGPELINASVAAPASMFSVLPQESSLQLLARNDEKRSRKGSKKSSKKSEKNKKSKRSKKSKKSKKSDKRKKCKKSSKSKKCDKNENNAPVASAGSDQTTALAQTVQLDGSNSSDVNGDRLTFGWLLSTAPVGSAASISDLAAVMPTLVIDLQGTYVAELTVNDGTVDSAPDTVTITTRNSQPVADAGEDQTVFVGNIVTLNGAGSNDVDGDSLVYRWSFSVVPTGSAVIFSDPAAPMPTFAIDLPGTYVAELIVNDGLLDSVADTVSITTQNSAPLANAGPGQSVFVAETVHLDGSGSSDVDGDLLSFDWSLISIPAVSQATLSDNTSVMPTFIIDQPGTYVAQLFVNDSTVDSLPDTVTIVIQNSPPLAAAGPDQTAFVTDIVQLDGSGSSDVDGNLLTFQWSLINRPLGSAATLSDTSAVMPTFEIDTPGAYVIQLIVNDSKVSSAPDTVTIVTQNSAPLSDAGPDQSAFVTDIVQLDGSRSVDVDGDVLSFNWSLIAIPSGSSATLSESGADSPGFLMDVPGIYVAQLIVNDGVLDSAPDSVVISSLNSRPVANAGQSPAVSVGDLVTLDGSGSNDVDSDPLTFSWAFTSIPPGSSATLSGSATVAPEFTADLPGTYVIQLIVNDGFIDSATDSVVVVTLNTLPVADAGPDQLVFTGDLVVLDASGSADIDGDSLTYNWDFSSKPTDSAAVLANSTEVSPTFTADLPGTYSVELVVNDGTEVSTPDTVSVQVLSVPMISSLGQKFTLAGSAVTDFQVSGANLGGSVFIFHPEFVPPVLQINNVLIEPDGTSARMDISVAATGTGSFVLVATNDDGSSDFGPSEANTLTVLIGIEDEDSDGLSNAEELALGTNPLSADTDADGFIDAEEIEFGSSPLDASDIPINLLASAEGVFGVIVSLDSRTEPDADSAGEASGVVASILNRTDVSVEGINEAHGAVVSVFNQPDPGESIRDVNGIVVSVLNESDPSDPPIGEAVGDVVSVENLASP